MHSAHTRSRSRGSPDPPPKTLTAAGSPGADPGGSGSTSQIIASAFGTLPDGRPVEQYCLRNRRGMQATIATYGGTVTRLTAPDRRGHYEDVVLGYEQLA